MGKSKVPGVPEHSDGASHGGCASQDKGRDGASEDQGHEDSSPTRSQVAAALNVLSSGGESQHNVHRQDGQRLASPSGGEPQQVAAALDVLSSVENVD